MNDYGWENLRILNLKVEKFQQELFLTNNCYTHLNHSDFFCFLLKDCELCPNLSEMFKKQIQVSE